LNVYAIHKCVGREIQK